MAKKKHVPAMYPKPDPVSLNDPLRVIGVNRKRKKINLKVAGSPPPELMKLAEIERRRLNLNERLKSYAASCLVRVMPHFGERPKYIPAAKWRNIEHRIRLLRDLASDAPAEARDAFMALQALYHLVDELVAEDDYSDGVERALCWAIDLGQLLQRGQTQIDHGAEVAIGKQTGQALNKGTARSKANAQRKSEAAKIEFQARMKKKDRYTTQGYILKLMSEVLDENGELKYGSVGAIKRYKKDW